MSEAFRPTPTILKFAQILQPNEAEPPVLSTEVRGAIRQWMMEISAHEELLAVGLKPRKSLLLSGPPGCGKTTLAHHVGQRLGLPVVLVNLFGVVSKYIGESAENLGKLFTEIESQAESCILFLDEFDSIATARQNGGASAGKEQNSIAVALLQNIDRFSGTLIAATNRSDAIDPAVWRRFGMQLEILEPDDTARFAILKRYLRPFTLPDEALNIISEVTAGASPAVLCSLMEGIKRDLVLCPRYGQSIEALDVFSRLIVSCKPHSSANQPLLWIKRDYAFQQLSKINWPPARTELNNN